MKVVIGVDGSHASIDAMAQACRLLSPARDSLTLCYSPPDIRSAISFEYHLMERGQIKLSESILDHAMLHVPKEWNSRSVRVVGPGEPANGILKAAEELAADLIVIGTRGLGGLGRLLIGSVSRKIVHRANIPVLVVRKRPRAEETAGMRILLACESNETGRELSKVLERFAWPSGSVGEVIHVVTNVFGGAIPDWLDAEARKPEVDQLVNLWVQHHDERLAAARKEMTALGSELPLCFRSAPPIVVEGTPDVEILKVAQRQESDLIVIGAKTSTPFGRLMAGSTCESVLNHAPCSVLVVRHP